MSQSLRCVVFGKKNSISYNSCQYSLIIASGDFKIDRVTTQHTPKCVENCSDRKVSYNISSYSTVIFVTLSVLLCILVFSSLICI